MCDRSYNMTFYTKGDTAIIIIIWPLIQYEILYKSWYYHHHHLLICIDNRSLFNFWLWSEIRSGAFKWNTYLFAIVLVWFPVLWPLIHWRLLLKYIGRRMETILETIIRNLIGNFMETQREKSLNQCKIPSVFFIVFFLHPIQN